MNLKELSISLAVVLLPMLYHGTALAADWTDDCKIYPRGSSSGGSTEPREFTLSAYNAPSFDPETPNGTVIASQEVEFIGDSNAEVRCKNFFESFTHGRYGGATADPTYNTLPTSVQGIGVRMRFSQGLTNWWPWTFPGLSTTLGFVAPNTRLLVELVKTGRVTAGGSLTGELARSWITQYGPQKLTFTYAIYKIGGSIQIKPTVPTCAVTTKTVNIPFGEVSMTDTAGGPERSFKIGLKCSGGTGTAKTRMYITLTDATKSANRSNILNLTSNSTAEGVGVQIKNGTTTVSYGPDSSATGTQNQWFVTETGNTEVEIPLTARYVRTGAKLKGGTADAIATFTMSYQ
ncbi:fimbrial protein [Burkholderia sp. NLJ2]|uniref:fimbrial protein n=1 Tax=Burkholderia sp. NLJ2 TaxID=3090699 RepID=UPI003C6C2207